MPLLWPGNCRFILPSLQDVFVNKPITGVCCQLISSAGKVSDLFINQLTPVNRKELSMTPYK